jgi:hypothetical protein
MKEKTSMKKLREKCGERTYGIDMKKLRER